MEGVVERRDADVETSTNSFDASLTFLVDGFSMLHPSRQRRQVVAVAVADVFVGVGAAKVFSARG